VNPEALEALPFLLVVLAAAAAAAFLLTPLAMRVAEVTGAIDAPDAGRRVHSRPIPRAGGLAVVTAFVAIGIAAVAINESAGILRDVRVSHDDLLALLAGVALAAAFGFIDDRWQIRARWQFLLQIALAAFAIALGVSITFVNNPLEFLGGILSDPRVQFTGLAAVLVTALWIVGMINSINFIDGLDGLSTGVALIAVLTLGFISLTPDLGQYEPMVALLCAVLAGALAGFLPWNFHPARVFIGTTGVFAMGYALAVLSILGSAKVAVALLVLGVPIIDTFWIITRRLLSGHSPFEPDRGHIHHRLLDLGLTHRRAVLLIYGICIVLAVLSIVLAGGSGPLYAFTAIVIAFGLGLFLVTLRGGSEEALDADSYPDGEPVDEAPRDGVARTRAHGPATSRPDDPGPRGP
jgi:UDP-GlcNAc:undecaprenyl-phosphate GlcNAc-1-phosphate transferase